MADVLTTQILEDGDRNAVVKIVGTQVDGDLTYTVVIDPADYHPTPWKFRLDVVQYSVEPGLTVSLWWDADTPAILATLAGSGKFDAHRFGGIQNDAVTPTGSIALSTEGWTADAQFSFTLLLQLVKCDATQGFGALLTEAGGYLLQENGGSILLGS